MRDTRALAEEPDLAGVALGLPRLCLRKRRVQRGHQLGTMPPPSPSERVARARVDQRLDHALVAEPQVDTLAQLHQGAVGPVRVPAREDRFDRPLTHVLDRAQAEADALVAHHRELEARLVHVGGEDEEAQLARLVDVTHHVVGIADLRRQQRGHELRGVVRLEPRRLVGEHGVRDRVRLVEPVAAEGLDLRGDVLDRAAVVSQCHRALHEAAELVLDQLFVFLAHRLAQHVGFGEREAREHVRDAHHLLLVGDDPVGRLEDLLQGGVGVADRLATQLAVDEDEMHPGVERSGAEQRVGRDQVVEPVAFHVAQTIGGERRLELENAGGPPRSQQPVDLGIGEVERVHVEGRAVPRRHHPHRVVDHGQRAQPEHVDLEHPHLLERHHIVLRDDGVRLLRSETDGDVIGEGTGSDHHARGVHRCVACQALDARPQLEDLAHALVLAHELLQLRGSLRGIRQRGGHARAGGNELGEAIHLSRLHAQRARHVAEGGARLERPEGDDLADRVPAVPLADVLDHLAPSLETEVEVDVRHGHALGVQEPLEQQIELEGVDVGDAQGVRHQRPRCRAAPRPYGDGAVLRGLHDVVDDQEVARVPGLRDDAQLVVEPLRDGAGERIAVAGQGAGARQVDQQVIVGGECRRARVLRQEVALLEVELAQLRDACGFGDHVGALREERRHLRLGLDVALLAEETKPVGIVQIFARADREQHVVRLRVFLLQVVCVVRGDDGETQLGGQLEHAGGDGALVGDSVVLHLQPETIRAEQAREVLGARFGRFVVALPQVQGDLARQTRGQPDQALAVLLQHLAIDPGPAVIALEEGDGRELDQVTVPGAILREQHEMGVSRRRVGRPLALVPAPEREVGLEPENRPQRARPGLGVELPRPVQVAVIGDGEGVHAQRVDPVEQLRNPVGAVEEGVLAVRVEMDERHTARRRYRRSCALSKPRRAGYFAPDARRREPVRTGPDDGPFSSGDGGRPARGAGHARARLPAARRVRRRRSRPSRAAAPHHRVSPRRVRGGPVAGTGAARRGGCVALHRRRGTRRDRPRRRRGAGAAVVAPPARRVGTARGRGHRVSAPHRRDRVLVGEPVVPPHRAPVTRRRRGGGAGARRLVGRVVPGAGDGHAERARRPRSVRSHAPGRHGVQGRRRGDRVRPAARRGQGGRQPRLAARDGGRPRPARARDLPCRRRAARLRRESLPRAGASSHRAVPRRGRPGRGRGRPARAARDHHRGPGCRGLSRQFRARPRGAGPSRAETRLAFRLHLIVRPGGRRLAAERIG